MKEITALLLCFFNSSMLLIAQAGYPDLTFGKGGVVTTTVGTSGTVSLGAFGVAIQPDGKLVTVGGADFHFALTRYDSTGKLDNTFGTNGKVITVSPSGNTTAKAVKIQADGKIVVTGMLWGVLGVVRYNANGTVDNAFGNSGYAYTSLGSTADQSAQALAIQTDGRILLAGYVSSGSSDSKMAIVRFNTNGSIDSTFGTAGAVTLYATSTCKATGITIQPDNKIVITGWAYNGNTNDIALVRFHPDGTKDTSFGLNGQVITSVDPADNDEANAITLQADGKIVVCGKSAKNFVSLRYLPDGSLDHTFGTGGIAIKSLAANNNIANTVSIQKDGKIVLGGQADYDFGIVRYTAAGLLDTTFGSKGVVITSVASVKDYATGMAIQSDGKIVAVGYAQSASGDGDFAIVRYHSTGSIPKAPQWEWAKGSKSIYSAEGSKVCADNKKNVYMIGRYTDSTLAFDNIVLKNNGPKEFDVFFVKYNSSGKVLWAKGLGGPKMDLAQDICVDRNGNVSITGIYNDSMNIDGTVLHANGLTEIFTAKFNENGKLIWASSAGGAGYDGGKSISTDDEGYLYVAGEYSSTSIQFGNTVLTNPNKHANFIVKYDAVGHVMWAKRIGETYEDQIYAVKSDATGNVYVAGFFNGASISFDNIILTNGPGTSYNVFLAAYDAAGNARWAKSPTDRITASTSVNLAIDPYNNVYLSGDFSTPTLNLAGVILTNASNPGVDGYMVKYDPDGKLIWAKQVGGAGGESILGMDINPTGLYITGSFGGGALPFGYYTLLSKGMDDVFIAKYDLSGNVSWAKNPYGEYSDRSMGVATDVYDNVFITGNYMSPTLKFDTIVLSHGQVLDLFISKIKGDVPYIENCIAHYSTVYSAAQNTFDLTVDSTTAISAVSYKWDFGDGTTSTSPNPQHLYTEDKLYNVCMKITTASGESCSYCHIIGKDALGNIISFTKGGFTLNVHNPSVITNIGDLQGLASPLVYPNPSNGRLTITSTSMDRIEIYNVLGELMYSTNLNHESSVELDLSNSAKGMYLLKIYDAQHLFHQKISLQ